ncbi:MAG: sigma-70 family RNA polymerase sigma factor [Halobacteriovoraceae bacterium]|nr:sigma-70 family RNA polymerase sigma factor [Halobacteriovoraceae bacterium]
MSDEELMEKYIQGSVSAFEELYQRYHQKVMGFIAKKVKENDKEEVFQLVFVRLHQKKHLFDSQFPFAPWFFTLIRHVVIDHYRKEKVDYVELAQEPEFENDDSQEEEHREEANKILANLKDEEAILLYKKFVDGLTYKELERELKSSPSALRKRVSRLIKKIKGQE